jgi:RNase P/RNase MRP subunit POP5
MDNKLKEDYLDRHRYLEFELLVRGYLKIDSVKEYMINVIFDKILNYFSTL